MQGLMEVHTLPLNSAHLEHDSFLKGGSTQGTPVWWATKGVGVWVRTPKDFRYAVNRRVNGRDDGLVSVEMSGVSSITYDVFIADDARQLLQHIIRQIGYSHSAPPAEYMRLPIYSAWVELGGGLNQEKMLEYARTIRKHNLPAGVIEIDMGWETKYGDLKFDAAKFPNPKAMVDALHRMGFKVTLWVSNFVNVESEMFAAHRNDGMFCRDLTGNVGLIGWWAGEAAVWDYGNLRAAVFYRGLLNGLQEAYGVDGFKFDGGESNLAPQGLRGAGGITQFNYSDYFNREAVAHYPWNESRVGIYAQAVATVQRLQDKRSLWGNQNGLDSLITQVFNCSLRGFFYVLPDIVGGSAGSESAGSESVDKELLIRWGQASALMPLIQFSRGPWHYDEETIRLVRELSNLHVKFSPYIYQLAVGASGNGEPIIAPLWYQAPADRDAIGITDEFMVGKDVVVAPVLSQGARQRRLYLPEGNWSDYKTGSTLKGAAWLDDYPAPLDTLPIFIRCGSDPAASGKKACGP
jgi:alpha-glucosidase (family GH31 glycosyl hydrolase)